MIRYVALSAFLLLACSGDEGASNDAPGRSSSGDASTSSSGGAGGDASSGGATSSSGGTSSSGSTSGATNCKRGVAYGHHSDADLRALRPGISWWYNWTHLPDPAVRSSYASLGVEYVPMIWGAATDTQAVTRELLAGATTLLGYNEPNFFEQANMSATDAAARWPEVEAVADAKGLQLVSPAVNFCGGGCHDGDPYAYLEDFFAACDDCRVDALAVHVYVGCAGDGDNHARWLIDHLRGYEERFSQPIWLTEFACDDASSEAEQLAFLRDAVTYLEGDPRIARYAWFAGRADNVRHVDLLGADGQLTALGQAYVSLPSATPCH